MPALIVAVAASAASDIAITAAGVAATSLAGAVIGGVAYAATSYIGNKLLGGLNSSPTQPLGSQALAQQGRGLLINTAGTIDPIPVIYGARRIGGTTLLTEVTGANNEYLTLVVCHCEGEIEAIDMVYLDGIAYNDAKYAGLVTLETHLGTDAQAASTLAMANSNGKWTSDHKVSGCAYSVLLIKYDQNVFRAVPVITADVRGRKVYDPRTSTTGYSDNPALCIRDYLTNARFGRGLATSEIDDTAIADAANYCDVAVAIPGGGTQPRYTCNGVINVDANSTDNITSMLSCCRGMLVFTGGLYKLVLDAAGVSSFSFDEDNIVGAWSISLGSKRSQFNRVAASFFNPDNSWQPDIATADSPTYRTADNGLMLEDDITLSFTTNFYEAQLLAQRHLKQSRFGITVSFRATIGATLCEIGDIVDITHTTPGWTAKLFRVLRMAMMSNDEVEVTVQEYDSSVYTADPLTAARTSSATSLPDPSSVGVPGNLQLTESLYQTTGSAGVKSRATLTWDAPADALVAAYEVEYKLHSDSVWTEVFDVRGTSYIFDDMAPGTYDFRVKARNLLGFTSAYSITKTAEVYGLTANPSDPTGFSVRPVAGLALCSWDRTTDLDVKIGGDVVIRFSPATSGATWENSVTLPDGAMNGDAYSAVVALAAGTYFMKFKDSTGHYSTNAASFVLTSAAILRGWSTAATVTEDPTFSGTKTNCVVSSGNLQLDTDVSGNVLSSGEYDFAATLDLGTKAARRFHASITAACYDIGALFDAHAGLFDSASGFFDGTGSQIDDCTAVLYASISDDNVNYSSWMPFYVADFDCRYAKFKLLLSSGDSSHNIDVSALSVTVQDPV